jgi:hypothetical protein
MNENTILNKQQEKARIERESIMINPTSSHLVDDFMGKCGYSLDEAIQAKNEVIYEDGKTSTPIFLT